MAERIVGIAALDHVLGLAVALEMLLVDVIGHHPGRIVGLVADGPDSRRRLPVKAAESDRKGVDDGRMRTDDRVRLIFAACPFEWRGSAKWYACLALPVRRRPPTGVGRTIVIVQAHLGDVHDDPGMRRARQDVLSRDDDELADRRRPPIHVIVGVGNFVRAKPVPSRDVEQRVALANGVGLQRTDQVVAPGRHRIGEQRPVLEIVFTPAMGKPRSCENRDRRQQHRHRAPAANPRTQPRPLVMHCYAHPFWRAIA